METRRYGGTDFYWEFSGPLQDTNKNGKYYCSAFPNGCVSSITEKSVEDFPNVTEEDVVLICLSW